MVGGETAMTPTRRQRLIALGEFHDEWLNRHLAAASTQFDPSGRKDGSDYNQHHADLDAGAAAQDEFSAEAARILGLPVLAPVVAHGNHDQSTHGRKKSLKLDAPKPAPKRAGPKAKPAPSASDVKPPAASAKKSWTERIATGVGNETELSDPENASHVYLITFGDGSRAVAKYPKADYEMGVGELDAEELGASVARELGLSPPEVHRADDQEAYFTYLGDTDPDAVVGAKADFDKAAGSIDAKRIGLLDVLTENTDRNSGNWFATPDGRIIPIDHGMSWAPARTERDGPETAHWPSGFAEAYTAKVGAGVQPGQWVYDPSLFEAKWVDNDLSKEYVASLRPKLKALRPEFERLGHTDWHDRMMARLDIVEQHAKGTVAL